MTQNILYFPQTADGTMHQWKEWQKKSHKGQAVKTDIFLNNSNFLISFIIVTDIRLILKIHFRWGSYFWSNFSEENLCEDTKEERGILHCKKSTAN